MPPGLVIRLLGPVDISVDGEPLAVDTRKAVAVLAYLATTGRPSAREVLAALLWPEADGEGARGALRRTLSVLNAAVGDGRLEIDRSAVALARGAADLDVASFRTALTRVRGHRHDPDAACHRCIATLRGAAALDRGAFMDGFSLRDSEPFDEWLLAEREDYRRELAGALERLAGLELADGDAGHAIATGRRWLDLDPLHEPAHRLLMEAHARAGEPAAAIRQYRDCVRTLDRELGVGPLPETAALYEAIRDGAIGPATPVTIVVETRAVELSGAGAGVPLVGRDAELATLSGAIDTIGPDGVVIAIEGEAGIGKSRLGDAISDVVRGRGGRVLAATAYPGEAGIAFGPIVSLLRAGLADGDLERLSPGTRHELARLLPEVPAGAPRAADLDGPFAVHRLLEAVSSTLVELAASAAVGCIRIDDIQWADESSLEVLAYLARRLEARPVGLFVTFRREDLDERTAPPVGRLVSAASTIVRLERLPADTARSLATAAWRRAAPADDDTLASLVAEAEGLPLYLVEGAATDLGGQAMPPGIRALLAGRLADVSEVARQVATAGAVLGRSFDVETLRLTSGRSDEETVAAIDELVRRGIVREGPGSDDLDFVHGRLRDVAVESMTMARRRLLHRRAAEALRSGIAAASRVREPTHALAARIARHEREAGRDAEAAAAFLEAGELARAVFANREAEVDLEAALALGHTEPGRIHAALGDLRTLAGDYAAAIEHYEAAAALAEPEQLAEIEHRLALVHQRRGDYDVADGHYEAALELVAGGPELARLLADRSLDAQQAGRPEMAASLAADALAAAESSGDPLAVARAANVAGVLATEQGDPIAGEALLSRSLALSTRAADSPGQVAALNNLARAAAGAGDTERAVGLTEEALALCRSTGDRHREAALHNNLADLLHADGRQDAAMEHLKAAVTMFAEVGDPDALEPGKWRLATW